MSCDKTVAPMEKGGKKSTGANSTKEEGDKPKGGGEKMAVMTLDYRGKPTQKRARKGGKFDGKRNRKRVGAPSKKELTLSPSGERTLKKIKTLGRAVRKTTSANTEKKQKLFPRKRTSPILSRKEDRRGKKKVEIWRDGGWAFFSKVSGALKKKAPFEKKGSTTGRRKEERGGGMSTLRKQRGNITEQRGFFFLARKERLGRKGPVS